MKRVSAASTSPARQAVPLFEALESRTLASAAPQAGVAHPDAATAAVVQSVVPATPAAMPLSSVKDFSYVLANLNSPGAVTALAQSKYDMLVVDPTATLKGNGNFDMAAMVSQLHAADPGRVVLAYVSIGEVETGRTYWQANWKAPVGSHHGTPAFLLGSDPGGWVGSYLAAYWNPAWQKLFIGKNGIIPTLMKAGFDGVSLGWIGGYSNATVDAAAHRAGVNPARAMVQFVSRIRGIVKKYNPTGDVVGMNGGELASVDPAYLNTIDASIFEDTWFYGTPNSPWGDPNGGDLPTLPADTDTLVANYKLFQEDGKPVFTIDYALKSTDADLVYEMSSELGFVPLVTQISVSQTTTTPPPWLT